VQRHRVRHRPSLDGTRASVAVVDDEIGPFGALVRAEPNPDVRGVGALGLVVAEPVEGERVVTPTGRRACR